MRRKTEEPPKVGERYTVDVAFLGRRWEQSFEVSAFEPPRRYSDRNLGGPFRDEHTYTFEEEAGGGTHLSIAMDMQPGGFFRITGPLLEKATKRQVRKELKSVEDLIEARGWSAVDRPSTIGVTERGPRSFLSLLFFIEVPGRLEILEISLVARLRNASRNALETVVL